MLSSNLTDDRLVVKKIENEEIIVLRLTGEKDSEIIEIKLPTPAQVKSGLLMYSENMPHLILMQKAIVENLEKVVPYQRPGLGDDLMKTLLMKAM